VLSDQDILAAIEEGQISIDPFSPEDVQPSSVDLHLGLGFARFRLKYRHWIIDPTDPPDDLMVVDHENNELFLDAGEFALATTSERVSIGAGMVARLEGRSSLGRVGLMIHSTAGYVDPGFEGQLTLELSNIGPVKLRLYAGMRIAQISFYRMTSAARRLYGEDELGSKYQGQTGPTASRKERRA